MYVGHYPEGLAAAAFAANHHATQLGFDAEDLHTGEANPQTHLARVAFIEQRYLPLCSYTSAASAGIATALADRYGIATPATIHNTFPWSERTQLDGKRIDRRGEALSLYWYSQVIGVDRGIQDAIRAMALVSRPVQLHLRGAIDGATRESFLRLAGELGVQERMYFHPPVAPDELLSRAVEHDIGLALEQGTVLNRAICATNKLFFFMLAGLAIAATDVPGQAAVLSQHPDAASLYRPGDAVALAAVLDRWQEHPDLLRRAKGASLEAARRRWNWELESEVLVRRLTRALNWPDTEVRRESSKLSASSMKQAGVFGIPGASERP
jgi:glycosyltransferase involved in cell wall biosynthesis